MEPETSHNVNDLLSMCKLLHLLLHLFGRLTYVKTDVTEIFCSLHQNETLVCWYMHYKVCGHLIFYNGNT